MYTPFQFIKITARCLKIASHHIKKTINVAIILIILPKEATACQNENTGEYSLYRRGIPCIPRKCIGKNVKLTPKNSKINCLSLSVLLYATPVKIGHQVIRPTMIVNTAPILKT
jgi:hypothetical protein